MAATMRSMAEAPNSFREATRELLRETIFKAARQQLESSPWSEITMNDVAVAAGVSRQTLYNEFGNRDEFGMAFVMYEAGRFLEGVELAIRDESDDPRAAVEVAFGHFLKAAGEDPIVAMLLSDDGTGGMLPFVTTQGLPVIAWAGARIASAIAETWPNATAEDAALISETLVRLAISHVTTPAGSPEESAAATGRLLGPFIDQTLSASR